MSFWSRLEELPLAAHSYYLREYHLRRGALWDGAGPNRMTFLDGLTPGRALDAGCGTGRNAVALKRLGWDVIGCDVSAKAVRGAARTGVRAVLAPATSIGSGALNGPYELVLDVLGPASDLAPEKRRKYAEAVRRTLAPGGLFAVFSYEAQDSMLGSFEVDRRLAARVEPEPGGRWWLLRHATGQA